MRVLIACEYSGRVREAFRRRGHDAWSCDLLPAEDGSPFHMRGDAMDAIHAGCPARSHSPYIPAQWDLLIAHPTCTFMSRSSMRWLKDQPPLKSGKLVGAERRLALADSLAFFHRLLNAPVPRIAVENPRSFLIPVPATQYVQPHWFGDPAFKETGLWLKNLPPLVSTNKLTPPAKGTPGHKAWSAIHRASPGPNRWKDRSRTFPGFADAMAEQWGGIAVQSIRQAA